MRKYVLDANVLLDHLGKRAAALRVNALLKEALRSQQPLLMSVVNWGEVLCSVWKESGETSARDTVTMVGGLPVELVPVTAEDAFTAARLKSVHRLPYADSFAAALAMREKATLVTSDPDFERLGKQLPVLWLR